MNLKSILKSLKMNESTISMVLGAVVIVIVGLLVVNYFKGLDTGTTLPSMESEDLGNIQLPTTHKVAEGEDLWKISEKYYNSGYNWVDIAKVNNILAPYTIEVGQVLNIPDVAPRLVDQQQTENQNKTVAESQNNTELSESPSAPEVNKLTNTNSETSTNKGDTYTVVHGDNLWDIAVAEYGDGYKWVDIARANNLVNPSVIHAGNVFVIPR